MIILNSDGWNIRIDPSNGGLFHLCEFKQNSVFRPFLSGPANFKFPQTASGNFPLLPYSNRIANGRFSFAGQNYAIPANTPGQKHPLHGTGWLTAWNVQRATNRQCHLRQNYHGAGWPWNYMADHIISVEDNRLRLELIITNSDKTPMPVGLGFHPYFPDLDKAFLSFQSRGVWLADKDVLPKDWVKTSSKFDFTSDRRLRDMHLDHCFTDIGSAKMTWESSDKTITLRGSKNLKYAAVYTAHDDNAFCFEPISHVHNAINMDDPAGNGIVTLEPRARESCWCEIDVDL